MTRQKTLTADGVVCAGPGVLEGNLMITDGTNDLTIKIHDNAAEASGTVLLPAFISTTAATKRFEYLPIPSLEFQNGMYLDLTLSAGAASVVFFYRNN
jgi:hypothetical protein